MILSSIWVELMFDSTNSINNNIFHSRYQISFNNNSLIPKVWPTLPKFFRIQILLKLLETQCITFFIFCIICFIFDLQTLIRQMNKLIFISKIILTAACSKIPFFVKINFCFVILSNNRPDTNIKFTRFIKKWSFYIFLNYINCSFSF